MTVSSEVKQTLACIRGSRCTLNVYSLQERDKEAKNAYIEAVTVADKIIKDLEKRIETLELEEPQYKGN